MDINVVVGKIHQFEADAAIIYLFENTSVTDSNSDLNTALGGAIADLVESGDFTGKSGQVTILYSRGAIPSKRIIVVGLGESAKFTLDAARKAVAQGVQKARELKANNVVTLAPRGSLDTVDSARAVSEGALLGLYQYKTQKLNHTFDETPHILTLLVDESDVDAAQNGIKTGTAIAAGTNLTRELVNLPPNTCTPIYLAQAAQKMAGEVGLKIEILEEQQMQSLKMGALLAVAQGSDNPPRFIILEHNTKRSEELDTIVLVGKGVTFDTGGYDIKTHEGMGTMKIDMAGGAAVIGAMRIVASLDIPLHVVGLIPAVENMINGKAFRPQDVITASNGVTIEIISTDAEGRMLLADALVYASRCKPAAVVDIATLTGACVVALGSLAAGLFCTDDKLKDTLMSAADSTGERLWQLPLYPEYDKAIESQVADIKNSGGRMGGVGTSAIFLKHFADYPAWAHIDMAAMAAELSGNAYIPSKGASGYGARLLAEFVQQWANSK